MDDCARSPSGALLRAFGEFNRGDWFDCHETLEDLWVGSEGEIRAFYQGLLQIAVALHHWRNGNFKGSVSLLTSGTAYLRQVSAVCQRIMVEDLVTAADRFRETLMVYGPGRMSELDTVLIPRLKLAPGSAAQAAAGEEVPHD